MNRAKATYHKPFLILVVLLTLSGFFIFFSASLGLLGRDSASFSTVAIKQFIIMLTGLAAMLLVSKINYQYWQKFAWLLFLISLVLTLLVFVPGLGVVIKGGQRWIHLAGFSIQTSEFLKLGYAMYLAALFSRPRTELRSWRHGFLPFILLTGVIGIVMIAQPDISTLGIMLAGGVAMFFAAGARWRDLGALLLIGILSLGIIIYFKPYIQERIKTFFDPSHDPRGASYQITQSLIAIGSGSLTGRGFGQSVQKFKYLPEPIGDSIFSVAGEEFGFVGTTTILLLFLGFALMGLKIANRAPNQFSRLLTIGIVIMIMAGVFINVASMVGLIPLNGTPLLFVSQGGTSLLLVLIESGIILNISKHHKKI